jgi:hypothetical protein
MSSGEAKSDEVKRQTDRKPADDVVVTSVPATGAAQAPSESVLVIDVGGTKVKMLLAGKSKPVKALSGPEFTPERLIQLVRSLDSDWNFGMVSIGFPGLIGTDGPLSEPGNLGPGWVGFDFASALGCPVKIVNDAVMQGLGSYDKGRMLFLGLGTGIGSALIADHLIVPLELGHLRYDAKRTFNDVLSRAGLRRYGKRLWRRCVEQIVPMMLRAFVADYVVLGGGNAKNVKDLPPGARLGHNRAAFRGGFRLWEKDRDWTLAIDGTGEPAKENAEPAASVAANGK